MNLLIVTPTWETPDGQAMREECRAAVEAQQIGAAWTWRVYVDNPHPIGDFRNVLHHYQRARAECLDGDFDALLTIEHDNVLPDADAVQRLLDTPGDVIYAPYVLRHGAKVLSTWQYINRRNLGEPLDRHPHELARAVRAGRWPVSGTGMGCTLFRRRVLEALPFEASSDRNACPDLGFAERALRRGYDSFAQFTVPVWHYDPTSDRWLHPLREVMPMSRYIATRTANAYTGGRDVRLVAGEEIELTDDEARALRPLGVIDGPLPPVPGDDPTGAKPLPEARPAPPAEPARTRGRPRKGA